MEELWGEWMGFLRSPRKVRYQEEQLGEVNSRSEPQVRKCLEDNQWIARTPQREEQQEEPLVWGLL